MKVHRRPSPSTFSIVNQRHIGPDCRLSSIDISLRLAHPWGETGADRMRNELQVAYRPQGKHPDQRLSAAAARSVKESCRYADGNDSYLIVDPSGTRRWLPRAILEGKRCDIAVGGRSLLSRAEAREKAAKLRKCARANGDPLAERRAARTVALAFEQAARQVRAEDFPIGKNPKGATPWINDASDCAFPVFGSKRVDSVEANGVNAALLAIRLTNLRQRAANPNDRRLASLQILANWPFAVERFHPVIISA